MARRLERGIDWGTRLKGADIGYGFVGSGEKFDGPLGEVTTLRMSHYEKVQFKLAFKLYASFTDLEFHRVKDATGAKLQIATYKDVDSSLGAMEPPGPAADSGYGVFNNQGIGWEADLKGKGGLVQGGFGFITIIHELGHGLGLAHPHDKGGSSVVFRGVSSSSDLGDADLNQGVYTMMSYNDGWKTDPDGVPPTFGAYGYEGTPMAIDIAVLQKKYGANDDYHTGRDSYRLPDANEVGTFYSCIWDAGGRDKIVNPSDAAATIDLRAATLKDKPGGGGYVSWVDGIFGGFTIAHGVTIENAKGGGGDDVITGNAASNRLAGRDGQDILDGHRAADRLLGGADSDWLNGGKGADRLGGGSGDDILVGGKGSDRLDGGSGGGTLTGGGGADTFVFSVHPAGGSVVEVTDFAPGKDTIALSGAAFVGLGAKGALAHDAFATGASAGDGSDRILYDPASGTLRHDPDGIGGFDAVAFAVLSPGLALRSDDFLVTG